jgi:uncharacterized protein
MHVKVNDILAQEVGYQTGFEIAQEAIEIEDVVVAEPLNGYIKMTRLEETLLAKGDITTAVQLECHRCLRTFNHPLTLKVTGEFNLKPVEEQWPIARDWTIDLAPMMSQEIILQLPIKQLCEPDCPGLCDECGQRLDEQHTPHK